MLDAPGRAAAAGSIPASTIALDRRADRCPPRPAVPPSWQNFRPAVLPGLWLAVNMMPGRSREPLAKCGRSVDARPRSITSCPVTSRLGDAAAISRSRQSRPIRMAAVPSAIRA